MAVIPKPQDLDNLDDITHNLPSLQFESALSDEEQELLILRSRSHALTVTVCAHATYFVSVLNEARQIKVQLRNPHQRHASRLLQEVVPRDPLYIGIIGCGRMGSHITNCLLTFGEVNPEEIKISTRRPETLVELQEKGVTCLFDNKQVAASVHILFLCVLPSQLPAVAEEIRGHISIRCTVYSLVSSISVPRLHQLLEYTNVIRPEITLDLENADKPWDNTLDVTAAFANPAMVEQTCPLSLHKDEAVVSTNEHFAVSMVYAFVNMCTMLRLSRQEVLDVVNGVVLGQAGPPTDGGPEITQTDLTRQLPTKDFAGFPKFDLTAVAQRETPLKKKLGDQEVRQAFVDRYCSIFSQYLHWKNFALQQVNK